jgi:ATP-dependent Zn protease
MNAAQEAKEILARGIVDQAQRAFQEQGEAAFDCPRHYTAYHEGGHAITGRFLFGWIADKLEVRPIEDLGRTQWSGQTFAEGETWSIDADTDPAADFKEALHLFAGKTAEVLLFPKELRFGSSLDEEEIVRGIVNTISIKTGVSCEYAMVTIMTATIAGLVALRNLATLAPGLRSRFGSRRQMSNQSKVQSYFSNT